MAPSAATAEVASNLDVMETLLESLVPCGLGNWPMKPTKTWHRSAEGFTSSEHRLTSEVSDIQKSRWRSYSCLRTVNREWHASVEHALQRLRQRGLLARVRDTVRQYYEVIYVPRGY